MNPLLWIALVTAAIVFSLWFPRWRLKRALAKPLPAEGLAVLENNIPVYQHMPAPLQEQLRRLVVQFLYQKKFVGCGGLEITDEMRYTIAGQACLLLLNRQTQVFADVSSIAALRGSLNDQSARVRRLEADGRQAAQEAQERLRRVEAAHIADEARIAALSRPVAGATACERAENRRAAVLEALR